LSATRLFREKTRDIYEALPKLKCGLCGCGSCGQFARAVAERRAPPFACQQNPWSSYRISQIIGVKLPAYNWQLRFASLYKPPVPSCQKTRENDCRGSQHGKCEIDPQKDCAWDLIIKRLEKLGRLSALDEIRPPRNFGAVMRPCRVRG
jgi:Na+-translocating ferredoxin:NAD+ oxidoreductase RNF subunit RnfB